MLSIFKKKEKVLEVSVEEIHNEIDIAEDKVIAELKELLKSQKVDLSSSIHSKAEKMKRLGFVKSEGVNVSKTLSRTEEELEKFKLMKQCYPLEKILTLDEFRRILDKYNLTYAPASEYIKDVPEKVINTLSECKRKQHSPPKTYKITKVEFYEDQCPSKKGLVLVSEYFSKIALGYYEYSSTYDQERLITDIIRKNIPGCESVKVRNVQSVRLDNDSLQIAAPASHFNQEYFEKLNQKCKVVITKDPIAFEFLSDGFVRILDKWGTEDDQSYLDPGLTNEVQN